jgi:hypothetical protein
VWQPEPPACFENARPAGDESEFSPDMPRGEMDGGGAARPGLFDDAFDGPFYDEDI